MDNNGGAFVPIMLSIYLSLLQSLLPQTLGRFREIASLESIWQQENSPIHTAMEIIDWFSQNGTAVE
jgi:hypothetical protein